MKNIINSPEILIKEKKNSTYIFLGGPIQGAPDWQKTIPNIDGITWENPKRSKIIGKLSDKDWNFQVTWETKGLRISDAILFWIPEKIEDIFGRDYAQTTKIELIENLVRGKKIFLGIHPKVNTRRFLCIKAIDYGIYIIHETLEVCLKEIKNWIIDRNSVDKYYFTSDTHFSQKRTLELSKRPFKNTEDMDWTMIERWNNTVPVNSTVYHLGDFGNYDMLKYLNGKINLVCGNYELKERENKNIVDFIINLKEKGFNKVFLSKEEIILKNFNNFPLILTHKPLDLKNNINISKNLLGLFGHIHGTQKIKKFGINVGVDSWNFKPVSEDELMFYTNAIIKGYYDDDVFS